MFVKLFEEFKETLKNTPILYKNKDLEVKVVTNLPSSINLGKNTNWCSNSPSGFYSHSRTSNMYRFIFSDGYKLRLTWDYITQKASSLGSFAGGTHWGQGGFVNGRSKFYDVLRPEDDSEPFYIDWKSDKKREIVDRIQSIPQKAIDAVTEYQNKMSIHKSENLNRMYREIEKIKVVNVRKSGGGSKLSFFNLKYLLVKIFYLGKEYDLECAVDGNDYKFDLDQFKKSFRNKYALYGKEIEIYLFDKMMEWCKKNNIDFDQINESISNYDLNKISDIKDCFSRSEVDVKENFIYRVDYQKNVEYCVELNDNLEMSREEFISFFNELKMAIIRSLNIIDDINLKKAKIRISTRNDSHQFDILSEINQNRIGGFRIGRRVTILNWWIIFQGGETNLSGYNIT